jgi:flagellar basal-body rod protein FlgC
MPEITLMPAIGISATGLDAESRRMEVIANNVANSQTTRGEDGKVFHRKEVIFAARLADAMGNKGSNKKLQGVELQRIVEDQRPLKQVYRPGHPDADENGYVTMPNISPVEEMVDMMSASRSYEANLAAVKMAKSMATQALDIMR